MTIPETMRVVEITQPGGPEVLKIGTRPVPLPKQGEVLIKVVAAGVNRPDTMQRAGNYPVPPGASDIPGLELAGSIAAIGEGVARWRVGDTVTALVQGGGYAEYCTAPAPQCLPIPKGLTPIEAASLPETFFTVWNNLVDRGRLRRGETALIHGGTGGIGLTAIQIARHLGATVIATAGSDDKAKFCVAMGAAHAINYRSQDFVAEVARITGNRGADVVLDMVGGDY